LKNCLKLLLFLIVFSVEAQTDFDSTSFNVSKADLLTNTYARDSTASALVIYEEGNSFFDRLKFKLITEIQKKVKILTKEGADHAIVEILLRNNDSKRSIEKISAIKASTYNLKNGQITFTTLDKNDIHKEVYNKNFTLIKFTLPNIQKGSVITYSYTIESPFMYKYRSWTFQDDIPKLYSEYRTSIPGNYDYNIKLVGTSRLAVNTSKLVRNCLSARNGGTADCTDSRYVMKDIPAFVSEDYMTTKNNYLSRIEYELKIYQGFDGLIDKITKTWKDADKELRNDPAVGKQIQKTSLVKDLMNPSELNNSSPLEKARSIYNFVQNNYIWNGEHKIFKDVSVKNLIKNKTGNISAINILLNSLFIENGIAAKPVLLSTRNNGFVTKIYPVISDFNYLIVQVTVDGKTYLLDATDKYLNFGELPYKCLNQSGRLLDFKNGSQWITIHPKGLSSILHKVDLKLDPDEETLAGTVHSRYTGYHSIAQKKKYFLDQSKYKEDFEAINEDFEISAHTVDCESKSEAHFNESFELLNADLNLVADKIYLDPFIIKFFKKNPFQLQERTYPVDFGYKQSFNYAFQIDLGEHYEVEEIAKDFNMRLPENGGDVVFNTKVLNNKLMIFLKIRFKKEIYIPHNYPSLKQFMSGIVDLQTKSLIVLKRK